MAQIEVKLKSGEVKKFSKPLAVRIVQDGLGEFYKESQPVKERATKEEKEVKPRAKKAK